MFTKILIANRGEIACRVIKTCRRLGIRTVAVYSLSDARARHVRLADEAFCVGPAAARESYLVVENILEAARQSGAQAIHPGYGFLSENEQFAAACADAGIVFIGPPIAAIRAMGSKSAAKTLMQQAGVPLVPGYHGDDQDPQRLRIAADGIGYPVLIKASAGGGGKGMRVVEASADFPAALASCKREASSSFANDQVLIEKYLTRPRHIEIQVFGDTHGNLISLHERDCSAQRRHQKVIEEAPAPGISAAQRAEMGKAACDAARAVGYVGAGTVEFIADQGGDTRAGAGNVNFYFMEMNTRLQVEHPVTEMITGLDLVEWQLRVAAGEALPLKQNEVPLRGHAIEVRIYAEEPEKGFLPSIGPLVRFRTPPPSANVRIDSGVDQGDEVGPHYDPMLAKLIVWDESRARAIQRMLAGLSEFQIAGVGNNIAFLSRLIDHAEFRAGRVDTGLIERERLILLASAPVPSADMLIAAALWLVEQEARARSVQTRNSLDPHSPWGLNDDWRLNGKRTRRIELRHGSDSTTLELQYAQRGLSINGETVRCEIDERDGLRFTVGARSHEAHVTRIGDQLHVFLGGRHGVLSVVDPLAHAAGTQDAHGGLVAPMPGKIIDLPVAPGTEVEQGVPLLIMEAMKMEHSLCAPFKGRVVAYLCRVGEQVRDGVELIDFQPTVI